MPAIRAVVAARRSAECPAAFAQPRWDGYIAYDLALLDPTPAATELPAVALAVAGDSPWERDTEGAARADLDRDGVPEVARQCAADEGEHFTLWSRDGPDGSWRRRAHEYYEWGGIVERTCRAGEDGRDDSETDRTT